MGWVRRKNNIHIEDLDTETLEEVMEFVGKNKDTYRKKWSKFKYGKKGAQFSWNWAAFIFGFFWFAYRKMNVYAYLFFGVITIIDVLFLITTKQTSTNNSSFFGVFLIIALLGNQSYLEFVVKKVNKLKEQYPNKDERLKLIKKRGGISWINVLIFILAMVVYAFAISIVEENVYQNYAAQKFEEATQLEEKGETKEAITIYEKLKNKDHPIPEISFNLALLYYSEGDMDKAEEEINHFLEYEPDDEEARQIKQEILSR